MSTYTITRSVVVDTEPERVLPLITRFENWRRWSPFEDSDPQLKREYRGPEEGTGAVYEWEGNAKAGAGIMTITEVTACQALIELEFLRPFKSSSRHVFSVTPSGGAASTVTWTMHGEQKGLTGLVTRFVMPMEKVMGPEFEKGLAALKDAAEADAESTAP